MGSNWPLHNAQPFGAKLKLTILISERNGSSPPPLVGVGNIPNIEMMKLTTRNGIMLSCGWDPPAGPTAAASMGTLGGVVEEYEFRGHSAQRDPAGLVFAPAAARAKG